MNGAVLAEPVMDAVSVSPGLLGFLVTFAMVVVVVLLMIDFARRMRRLNARARQEGRAEDTDPTRTYDFGSSPRQVAPPGAGEAGVTDTGATDAGPTGAAEPHRAERAGGDGNRAGGAAPGEEESSGGDSQGDGGEVAGERRDRE